MRLRTISFGTIAGSVALMTFAATAQAADIAVTDAAVTGGKLVVSGTAAAGTHVRVDGQTSADLNATAGADGTFSVSAVYHPGDCIVSVQKVTGNTLGAPVNALVADCGRDGLTPRGAWNGSAVYVPSDLVTYEGSAWRARRANKGSQPASGADWELFAGGGMELNVAPTGPAGGDLTGTYPNPQIGASRVGSPEIATNAVTASEIATGAVGTNELASLAVNTQRIAQAAIINNRLAPNAVTTDKVADGTLTGADIADSGITAADVAANTLTAAEIATGAVGSAEIVDNSITTADLANGFILSEDIADGNVLAIDIGNGQVRAAELIGITERQNQIVCGAGANCSTDIFCANDERLISGGVRGSTFAFTLAQSERNGNGWRGSMRNTGGSSGTLFVFAYCLLG